MGEQKIIKTGNSLAVTVPSEFVKMLGIKAGQRVKVRVEPAEGIVVYTFSGSSKQLSFSKDFIRKASREKK